MEKGRLADGHEDSKDGQLELFFYPLRFFVPQDSHTAHVEGEGSLMLYLASEAGGWFLLYLARIDTTIP